MLTATVTPRTVETRDVTLPADRLRDDARARFRLQDIERVPHQGEHWVSPCTLFHELPSSFTRVWLTKLLPITAIIIIGHSSSSYNNGAPGP